MKKTVAFVLAILMVLTLPLLVACGDKTPDGDDPNTDDPSADLPDSPEDGDKQDDVRLEPNLPEVNYENEEFRFYQWDHKDWRCWEDLWVDTDDGGVVENATFARNSYVEEKYGIDIVLDVDNYKTYFENVRTTVSTGEYIWDVVVSEGHCIPFMYTFNVFYNLHDVEYLDFDKPWWSDAAVEDFTLMDYMPFTVSSLTVLDKAATSACFFNKGMAGSYGLGNLYDQVQNGTWTMEQLIRMGEQVATDTGNDAVDDEDIYGLLCIDDAVHAMFHAFGMRFLTKDEYGYPQIGFNDEGNFVKIQTYLEDVMFNETLTYNREWYTDSTDYITMFTQEQGLFLIDYIRSVRSLMQSEIEYGILPVPKYDEDQEQYYSSANINGGNLLSVPITCGDIERAGVILEALSAESHYTVIPAFYDVVLKGRASRDAESVKMLDIIFESTVYDVGIFYELNSVTTDFLRITGNAHENGKNTPERTSDIASFWAERESRVSAALEDLLSVIESWNRIEQ